ncbi:Shikimate kinase [Pseudobythopirellula maris]|uniref:Shikimate kinase n=1 Tax=Pseudobythopirellula maris TaxID=2527991 RepID=A0A5C5ZHE3_9BACT|nr:shikimate kinase [Pseudobythopirellula maris]TWT86829.1 Shikimate kinase [Pseudobythopirellula maris]
MPDSPPRFFLTGYRGVGKTSVARVAAELLGWSWVDADVEVERVAGRSIAEIFAADGEPGFRDAEAAVVAELCGRERCVVALGGGALLRPATSELVRTAGPVVWLTATAETIHHRLGADPTTATRRPKLTDRGGLAEIEQLLAEREPHYRECATLTLAADELSPAELAERIVAELGLGG